ncbi:MAG: 23S rRNA (adenine(2503)-C(2))-methyltransferase RlmN, partial [Bdellovibrionota bacterium]
KLCKDGRLVEAVLIPELARLTLCISTQVGCAQACRFCQTGRMGLLRSLTSSEIVGQLIAVERWKKENNYSKNKVTNIVYMGMGEPLDNLESVIQSANIFCDPQGFFLSHNKVTVSTVGLLPQLDAILNATPICIALSLHSPFEEERSRMMPVNVKHCLTDVINCLKKHLEKGSRKSFLVQYTLIRGVNDTPKHAQALVELMSNYNFKINLIPLNEHEGTAYRRPDLGRVYDFQQNLKQAGLVATIRLSKGRDIAAACGQLIKDKNNEI